MQAHKKVYFASDFHLGIPDKRQSRLREMQIVAWLDSIAADASELYLLGDLFDFWYEYKQVVPKGSVRFQAKLAELCDQGIQVHVFTGNHDMWMFSYLEDELGVTMHRAPIRREWNGKKFLIGHGDGLGPGDRSYKLLKRIFSNRSCIWLFGWIHPDLGMRLANSWSKSSRAANRSEDEAFSGEENERLFLYCKETLAKEHFDYFIFGHRHLILDMPLKESSRYVNLGDWFKDPHYAMWDGLDLKVCSFPT